MISTLIRLKIPKILRFIHLQLFITLLCIPIFAIWGLPISLLCIPGNFLFAPFLSLFLMCSFFIFLCELLYIPNGIFIIALEQIMKAWQWCLSWHGFLPLIGFTQPSLITALSILGIAFALLATKKWHSPYKNSAILLLSIACCSMVLRPPSKVFHMLQHGKKRLYILHYSGTTLLIDAGMLSKSISCETWVRYTLLPELLKKTGSYTINHCICLNITGRTFVALATLCATATVDKMYLPYWQGSLQKNTWKEFALLQTTLRNRNTTLMRLGDYPKNIALSDNNCIKIEPASSQKKYQNIAYNHYKIHALIDNSRIDIYDPKQIKKSDKSS